MHHALEKHFTGSAVAAMKAFYTSMPGEPHAGWPRMMHGMGYNFEFYDALFALVLANVQLSFDEGDYTPRQEAMQAGLLPFCSEFGIELHRDLQRTHRALYAEFYRMATGTVMPERYPPGDANPWLATSRAWAMRMRERLATGSGALQRARHSLAYLWAVERLSVHEFELMRAAWHGLGVRAPYLEAHCAVEGDHDAYATRALLSFVAPDDSLVEAGVRAHEEDLAGYYREVAGHLISAGAPSRG
ncbi:MAG TPA: hypothetical protein VGG39_06990 [Polyangiaceae bacterium]|jgi:hypothetical protein